MEDYSFEAFLQRRGNILMILGHFGIGAPTLNQISIEECARRNIVFAFFASTVQAEARNAKRSVGFEFDHGFEETAIPGRIAVWGEAHNLVFVGIEIESKVKSNERIKDSDRITRRNFLQLLQSAGHTAIRSKA